MKRQVITKSKFQALLQCPKRLDLILNHRELASPVDEATQYRFDFGRRIEAKAQEMFPGGVMISATSDLKASADETKEVLDSNKIIFEAAFYGESLFTNFDAFIRVDVLEVVGKGKVKIYEIKSSTKLKDEYLTDVWFQKWVIENTTDLEVVEANVIYVDPDFKLRAGYSPKEMFVINNVLDMLDFDESPSEIVNRLKPEDYEVRIGSFCKSPFPCEFAVHCFQESGIGSVQTLRRGGKKIWELFSGGVSSLNEIPEGTKLTKFQTIQKDAEVTGELFFDKNFTKNFLDTFVFPAYFVDFESCNPLFEKEVWEGYGIYGQVVFQVSLHVLESPDSELKHFEYLHSDTSEPSESIANFLSSHIGDTGSVISYHKSFEGSRLKEIGDRHPGHAKKLDSIRERLVDLEDVFTKPYFYSHKQSGSTSIKKTLGVVCPEFQKAYDELNIVNNGQIATIKFLEMIDPNIGKDKKELIKQALLSYCRLDTEALVEIYKKLLILSS